MTTAREIERQRTAIGRSRLSVPARRAVDHGLINAETSVLDYGCGRGDDVIHLRALSVDAVGWDPHYRPHPHPVAADVVLLTYVLNVIDDLEERQRTLQRALRLARRCLVVSTRLRWDDVDGDDHADGVVTSRNTFQALHRPHEFRLWVQLVTGIRPLSGGPETAYLFTSDAMRISFVHRQFTQAPGEQDTSPQKHRQPLQQLAFHLERHGRMPSADERPDLLARLVATYGTTTRARRAADKVMPPGAITIAARRRTADLVVALAMDTFHGRPRFTDLPPDVRADIRAFFGSYIKAYRMAEAVLKAAGRAEQIERSVHSAKTGKITATSLYVHIEALRHVPPILRIFEACAQLVAGRPNETTLVRLRHDVPIVSYLHYPEFGTDAHPTQRSATYVDIARLNVERVSYARSTDPPILHRREEFVARNHPERGRWIRQTARDVSAGLYDRPAMIGTRLGWQAAMEFADAKRRR